MKPLIMLTMLISQTAFAQCYNKTTFTSFGPKIETICEDRNDRPMMAESNLSKFNNSMQSLRQGIKTYGEARQEEKQREDAKAELIRRIRAMSQEEIDEIKE